MDSNLKLLISQIDTLNEDDMFELMQYISENLHYTEILNCAKQVGEKTVELYNLTLSTDYIIELSNRTGKIRLDDSEFDVEILKSERDVPDLPERIIH